MENGIIAVIRKFARVFVCLWLLTACDANSTASPSITPTLAPAPATTSERCTIERAQIPSRIGATTVGSINGETVDVKFALQGPPNTCGCLISQQSNRLPLGSLSASSPTPDCESLECPTA